MQKITNLTKENINLSGINSYLQLKLMQHFSERQNEAVLIQHANEFTRKRWTNDLIIKRHQRESDVRKAECICTYCIKGDEIFELLRESNADLHDKLEIRRQENSELQKEVDHLRDEVKRLTKLTATINLDADIKQKEYARMKNMLTQTNEENVRLKNADQMLTKIHEENSELQKKVEQLLHEKTQLADASKHENDSRKKKESYENSSFQEEIRKLKKDAEQQHGKIKSLNDELMHAKESALKKTNECINLQIMLTEKNIEKVNINAADEIQRKLREKISELEDKVDQLLVDKKKLTEELRHEKDTVTKNDSFENTKLKEKNQKLQNNFDELYHENQRLHKQLICEKDNFKIKEKECIDMHQIMKVQKEHDLNLHATNIREKQLAERNTELQNEIQRLLQEKSNIADKLKQEREARTKLEKYRNTNLQETNQTLQNDVTQLRLQNERLREDLTREKDNLKKMELELFKIKSDMKEKLEKQELGRLTTKLSEKSVRNSSVDPRARKTEAEKDLQQQLDETRARLKNVQRELDNAKSRLSRAMGDKLTDNNPNIADLSDKNRPTKISERYQELYDNQWTDAFEIVNGTYRNEEKTINVLRDILMDTLEFCKTQAANQMIQIRASFLKGEDLPVNMNKQVKECRKAMAELYGKGLYREYCDQLRTSQPECTPQYVKECFDICWLMAVQDPPVVFGPDIRHGDTFNKDHYKAYTRSGERVDFVVWPVLLLHQDGPVLCKGVAQGR